MSGVDMSAAPSSGGDALPRPLGSYSRWRRTGAGTIYVAGVSARMPDGRIDGVQRVGDSVRYDVAAQTRRVLTTIDSILAEAGAGLADCIDMTVYLVRQEDFAEFNATYAEFITMEPAPTRTTIVVRGLPHPDMVVEIKAVAYRE